jgi:urease accessory protein
MMKDWTGTLHLTVAEKEGKTIASNVYFQGAFKVMRPIYHDDSGQVCYYILNPGGGYLDGDRYQTQITLEKNARMTLTTQSATKVYKTPSKPVYQETEIHLKQGSYLEYLADPLIAYKGASYKQKNIIRMENDSIFLYSDIVTPGWSPSGNPFTYEMLDLVNEIYLADKLVVFDHIRLEPATQDISGIGFMEGFSHLGTMVVVGNRSNSDLIDRLYRVLESKSKHYTAGISELPIPGFTIRVLADSTKVIEEIFNECLRVISLEWFDKEPVSLRKY